MVTEKELFVNPKDSAFKESTALQFHIKLPLCIPFTTKLVELVKPVTPVLMFWSHVNSVPKYNIIRAKKELSLAALQENVTELFMETAPAGSPSVTVKAA